MAIPVVVPLSTAGSLLAYCGKTFLKSRNTAAMSLLMPVSMLFDINATPPLYSVTTGMVVNAAPERVWKNVIAFPDITDQRDWFFRNRSGLSHSNAHGRQRYRYAAQLLSLDRHRSGACFGLG